MRTFAQDFVAPHAGGSGSCFSTAALSAGRRPCSWRGQQAGLLWRPAAFARHGLLMGSPGAFIPSLLLLTHSAADIDRLNGYPPGFEFWKTAGEWGLHGAPAAALGA